MDDAVSLAGLFIKSETFQKSRRVLQTFAADRNIVHVQRVAFDGLHHHEWRRNVSIQFKQRHDRLQQIRYFYAVGPNDLRPQGMGWKIGIGKYDRIAMSHFAENFQKFRRKQG